jgi:hypothetical protein
MQHMPILKAHSITPTTLQEIVQHGKKKLLEEVAEYMRLKHYSIHPERQYCDWIAKYVCYHGMCSREDMRNGAQKIEQFLTHLATHKHVSAATQNQAMNALVFLYRHIQMASTRTMFPSYGN